MKVEVEFTFCYIVGIQFVTGNLQWCKNLNQIRTIKSGWICEVHEVTKCMTNTQCDAFTFLTHPPTRKYLYSLSCPAITGVCLVEHRILLWCPCSRRCSQEVLQHFSKEEVHKKCSRCHFSLTEGWVVGCSPVFSIHSHSTWVMGKLLEWKNNGKIGSTFWTEQNNQVKLYWKNVCGWVAA